MEDIGLGTICLVGVGLLILFMLFRGRGGKSAPAGTYDSDRARSGGSFGGADAQRTTDSERVESGGSFGGGPTGAAGQRTNDSDAVRGGGSFGGGQRVEDVDRPSRARVQDDGASRASLGSRERGAPGDAKIENTIPKRPQGRQAAPDSSDSPFLILRDRLGDADDAREGRMSSTLGNRRDDVDDAVSRLSDRAEEREGPSARLGNRPAPRRADDDDDDGDSDRVRSGGSFGG